MSFSEAVQHHPELVKKYLGSVVPHTDNFFAALNSAVFSDGSFVYVPEGRPLPDGALDLLPHQRQGHRPVRADADHRRRRRASSATWKAARRRCATRTSCTRRSSSSIAHDDATIKYSTIQNWYPGDKEGKGGIYNFVTKRGICAGRRLEDHLDAGRDRLGDHLEVSGLHPAGRRVDRRVLLGRDDQQLAAGGHRHEDDPPRARTPAARSSRRAFRPGTARTPTAASCASARTRRTRATTRSATRC